MAASLTESHLIVVLTAGSIILFGVILASCCQKQKIENGPSFPSASHNKKDLLILLSLLLKL